MTWVAVAIGGSALIGAGASYAGSKKQSDASKAAGNLNMDMFNTLNQQQQPYIQSGYGAMGRLNTLLGLNPRPQQSTQPMQGMLPQGMPQGGLGSTAGGHQSAMLQGLIAQMMAKQGGSPGYMPTPGGGVQPIMQVGGSPAHDVQIPSSPQQSQALRMRDLLGLRAMNGDRQAQAMLQRMG
jgi:hypothetical protein